MADGYERLRTKTERNRNIQYAYAIQYALERF